MKKVLFIIASFMFVGAATVNAQEVAGTTKETPALAEKKVTAVNQEKTKITKDELPQSVQTTLAGDDFKGWSLINAYVIKAKNHYEVELKNGAELKTFKFDAEGKVIVE